jgi:N6-adenosine-specific RNA methylase IME4
LVWGSTEQLLFAVRGSAPIRFRSQPTWLFAPVQEHSHKPEEQYAIIERCSAGPYLELFARRKRPGWYSWGNEIDADVAL